MSEFGILVAAPEHRGTGVGRALVDFAEQRSRERGQRAMQLELLLPRTWQHPAKEFLKAWYGRIGYRRVRTGSLDAAYPHLAPLLATPSDLAVYEKPLRCDTGARKETSMFVELDTRHDARYTVSLEWNRDSGETQIVVADSGTSSVLVLPVPGENAGEAFRHPFRYAP